MHLSTLRSDLLAQLPPSARRRELLELLQAWLRSHLKEWNSDTRSALGLDDLVSMDLSRLPIDESALEPDEEIRQLRNVPPSSKDTFGMFLRDILWNGITVETPIRCPNCEGPTLEVLVDVERDEIVLACDQCGYAQTPSGVPWHFQGHWLQPASAARIQQYRDSGH